MPSKQAILQWWQNNTSLYHYEDTNICWGCGWPTVTERCHVRAIADGGDNHHGNLMLLCSSCHKTQESLCSSSRGRAAFILEILEGPLFMWVEFDKASLKCKMMTGLSFKELTSDNYQEALNKITEHYHEH
jgi:hypothetical protein